MLKRFHVISAAMLVLAGGVLGAGVVYGQQIVDEIICRVDDSIVTRADFEKAKQTTEEELKQQDPANWQTEWTKRQKDVLRDLIDQQLLLEKGKELGITGDTEMVKQLDEMRKKMNLPDMDALEKEAQKQGISFEDFKEQIRTNIVTQQVIGQEVGSKIHITKEDIQDFYNKHQKEIEGPEEVSLSEILVSTQPQKQNMDQNKQNQSTDQQQSLPEDPQKKAEAEAKAKQLLEQLRKGAKFEDVAKQSSDGPTALQGGAIGIFKRGELSKELEDKAFALKAGQFTDVIYTRQGYLILKVNEHRAAGVPPLPQVEDKIREAIYSERMYPAARAYLTKLREQAYIEIKPGYVDTGASPNPNKPVTMAQAGTPGMVQGKSIKKKKHFLIF